MTDAAASPTGRVPDTQDATTGPPVWVLALAGASVATGAVALLADALAAHVAGYLAASVLTILLVGVYRRVDLSRRLLPGYVARPALRRLMRLVLLASFVVAGVHVWAIATELAS